MPRIESPSQIVLWYKQGKNPGGHFFYGINCGPEGGDAETALWRVTVYRGWAPWTADGLPTFGLYPTYPVPIGDEYGQAIGYMEPELLVPTLTRFVGESIARAMVNHIVPWPCALNHLVSLVEKVRAHNTRLAGVNAAHVTGGNNDRPALWELFGLREFP